MGIQTNAFVLLAGIMVAISFSHPAALECGTDATTRMKVGATMMGVANVAGSDTATSVKFDGKTATVTAGPGVFFAVRVMGGGKMSPPAGLAATCDAQVYTPTTPGPVGGTYTIPVTGASADSYVVLGTATAGPPVAIYSSKDAAAESVPAPKEMHYRLEAPSTHLKVESCRDIPEGTYGDPVGSCEEHGYTHKCLSCMYSMEFFVKDAATCTQKSTECYFKGPGETCHGSSQCPHAGSATRLTRLRGVQAGCKTDADCPSSYCMNDKTKKAPYTCHGCGDGCCLTDKDCGSGSYCMNDHTKKPPYTCHGGSVKFVDIFA